MAKLEEIFKQKVNKTVEKETVHKFSLDEEGFYLWLVSANAQAKSGKQVLVLKTDDEDLQIKLNGKRQINKEPKAHKYWYWCGRTLKGVVKVFSKSFKKEDNINLVELFSDRTPRVSKFSISLKRIPTRDNPRWTGNFDDDIEELLLARLIFGEAENQPREAKIGAGFTVINRVKKQRSNWGFSNREVILKEGEYNAFWHKDRREKVRDPLASADALTKKAWQESYQIALDILNSSLEDSTEGATNFHSFPEEEKSRFPPWATDKNFKITLGDIHFYELEG